MWKLPHWAGAGSRSRRPDSGEPEAWRGERDCPSGCRTDWSGRSETAGRSRRRASRVHDQRTSSRHLGYDRAGSEAGWCYPHDGRLRTATRRARAVCLSTTDGCALCLAGARYCEEGIHVPVCDRGRVSTGRDAWQDGRNKLLRRANVSRGNTIADVLLFHPRPCVRVLEHGAPGAFDKTCVYERIRRQAKNFMRCRG